MIFQLTAQKEVRIMAEQYGDQGQQGSDSTETENNSGQNTRGGIDSE